MTRTTTWLSVLSCAVILAACSVGCGGSSPAKNTGKGGQGGHAGGGSAGSTGTAGAAAGDTGSAGAAGGDTGSAGAAGGDTGSAGSAAGSGGSAAGSTGSAGAAAGSTGSAGMDGGAADKPADSGNTDSNADVPTAVCGSANACYENGSTCETPCNSNGRSSFCLCYDPAGGPVRLEYQCFPNVSCTPPDAGTSNDAGTSDAGTDAGAGIATCTAGIMTGDACTTDGGLGGICNTACTNNMQRTCTCGRNGWRCSFVPHRCL
jgi:hypothetical protein